METIEYECEGCGEVHESKFMTSLPAQSFSRDEVAALNSIEAFTAVTGFDYHECHAHPDHAVATEELMVNMESELIALRLIGDTGWSVDARMDMLPGDSYEESLEKTIEEMKKEYLADDPHH